MRFLQTTCCILLLAEATLAFVPPSSVSPPSSATAAASERPSSSIMQQRATGRRGDTSTPSSSTTSPFSPSLYAWSRALTQQMGKVLLPLSILLPTAGGVVASLAPGPPQAAMAAELNLLEQLETLNKQVVLQDKLLRMAKNNKFEKRLPTFPVVKDGVRLDAKTIQNAIDRIQVLDAYLDEVERDIYQREWKYVPGFLQTFVQQEDAFIQLIEGLYPGNGVADKSSREALSYEAQNLLIVHMRTIYSIFTYATASSTSPPTAT
ncbi:hypothetical protein VYU27_007147, partial [Nannochloropsis oceanica]